jgi:spore germination protein GerM
LVWLALLLLSAVVFAVVRPRIAKAIESSGLADLFRKETPPADDRTPPALVENPPDTQRDLPPAPEAGTPDTQETAPTVAIEPEGSASRVPAGEPASEPSAQSAPADPPRTDVTPAARQSAPDPRTRASALYFVLPGADGDIALGRTTRQIAYTDTPLTRTLEALIGGPTPAEAADGYRSLIPDGTRIENITVRGGTAVVSFNEAFRRNPAGRAGLEAQLRQLVWTITEFENVRDVQVLIGGRATDYLGPEGIRIREPLSRQSLADGFR